MRKNGARGKKVLNQEKWKSLIPSEAQLMRQLRCSCSCGNRQLLQSQLAQLHVVADASIGSLLQLQLLPLQVVANGRHLHSK